MEIRGIRIVGVTLLSVEEVQALPERLRQYENWWWLRSPGDIQDHAAFVYYGGSVSYRGHDVRDDDVCVRPALKIKFENSNLKIEDCFLFDETEFEIISDKLAFCKGDIGRHCFRINSQADNANDYEKSDVKKYVDEWYNKNKKNEN